MPKIDFPMPTAKNRFQILNLHPRKHVFKKNEKNMVLNGKITKFSFFDLLGVFWFRPTEMTSDLDFQVKIH